MLLGAERRLLWQAKPLFPTLAAQQRVLLAPLLPSSAQVHSTKHGHAVHALGAGQSALARRDPLPAFLFTQWFCMQLIMVMICKLLDFSCAVWHALHAFCERWYFCIHQLVQALNKQNTLLTAMICMI